MYAVKILQENKSIRGSDNNCAHCFVEAAIAGRLYQTVEEQFLVLAKIISLQ